MNEEKAVHRKTVHIERGYVVVTAEVALDTHGLDIPDPDSLAACLFAHAVASLSLFGARLEEAIADGRAVVNPNVRPHFQMLFAARVVVDNVNITQVTFRIHLEHVVIPLEQATAMMERYGHQADWHLRGHLARPHDALAAHKVIGPAMIASLIAPDPNVSDD